MVASAPSSVKEHVPGASSAPAKAAVAGTKPKKKLKPGAPEPEPEPIIPAIAPAKLPTAPPTKVVPVPLPMNHGEELARKAVWAGAGIMSLFVLYLIADRFVAVVTRWPATVVEAVAPAHCDQFITLAKTAYGENWKVRLDPRDTTCDQDVKTEWERQKLTRYVPPPEPLIAPAATQVAKPQDAVRVSAPATRCLNVLSLAQAKYGAEWRAKLAVEDPECVGGPPKAAAPKTQPLEPAVTAAAEPPAIEPIVSAPVPTPVSEPVH